MRRELKGLGIVYILVLLGIVMVTAWTNQVVTVVSQGTPKPGRHTIIIDAGHGGVDGGATSCTGVLESQVNLEIALRLQDLSNLLGYKTLMIRQTDISIHTKGETIAQKKISDLKERVRIINSADNALLVSIHQNHFPEQRYSGAQVFHTGTQESIAFAKTMQNAFCTTINPGSKRQIKKASGIYLMEHITCTGVLVECGFLSNYEEEAKLRQPEYQKKLCCVILSSVCQYLST